MKFTAAVLGFGLASFTLAQSEAAGPSPTESVGCEPHGDHWHCEAHVSETGAKASATGDHDQEEEHDHAHEEHSEEDIEAAGPSPTESVGCEPHGDHWHCEGPVETGTGTPTVTLTETLPPSPTASTGCEPHGDHWHCEGPADAEQTSDTEDGEPTPTGGPDDGNAGFVNIVPLVGAMAAAALAL